MSLLKETYTIQRYQPSALDLFIESFNVYRFQGNQDALLFPKGVFEIVFQSNDHFEHHTSYSSGWQSRPMHFIGGLHNKAYQVKSTGKENYCITVEFKPNTAKYFIPTKLDDFQNKLIDIFEIWGNASLNLSQKINAARTDLDKVRLLEAFFLDKFIPQKVSTIDKTIDLIIASNGFITAKELAINASLSAAQYRKRFKEEVGISPSQYCKIIRVKSALQVFENNYKKSLTALSYELGYFDQAHFIKDFKSITGSSPKHFK